MDPNMTPISFQIGAGRLQKQILKQSIKKHQTNAQKKDLGANMVPNSLPDSPATDYLLAFFLKPSSKMPPGSPQTHQKAVKRTPDRAQAVNLELHFPIPPPGIGKGMPIPPPGIGQVYIKGILRSPQTHRKAVKRTPDKAQTVNLEL